MWKIYGTPAEGQKRYSPPECSATQRIVVSYHLSTLGRTLEVEIAALAS